MNDKQINILTRAVEVFSRYGFKKTTMGDIADQAGISRQTLYASYKSKEEVMSAAMLFLTDKTILEIRAAWEAQDTLSEKIDTFYELLILAYYRAVQKMPDAEELLKGPESLGPETLKYADNRKTELLEELFVPYEAKFAARGMTSKDYADFFLKAAASFKFSSEDEAHLARLLTSLKTATELMLIDS
ncbi:MAG: TetR/AcrR family transcriptional regulator [Hyphomicrobiales bacterium]